MITKAEFLEKILNINPKYNTELIGKAFDTAQRLHERRAVFYSSDQCRADPRGDGYGRRDDRRWAFA